MNEEHREWVCQTSMPQNHQFCCRQWQTGPEGARGSAEGSPAEPCFCVRQDQLYHLWGLVQNEIVGPRGSAQVAWSWATLIPRQGLVCSWVTGLIEMQLIEVKNKWGRDMIGLNQGMEVISLTANYGAPTM